VFSSGFRWSDYGNWRSLPVSKKSSGLLYEILFSSQIQRAWRLVIPHWVRLEGKESISLLRSFSHSFSYHATFWTIMRTSRKHGLQQLGGEYWNLISTKAPHDKLFIPQKNLNQTSQTLMFEMTWTMLAPSRKALSVLLFPDQRQLILTCSDAMYWMLGFHKIPAFLSFSKK